jgi:plastocyanin
MFRALAISAAVAVVSLTVGAVASARTEATPTLKGAVGPSFTISLKRNGLAVKALKAGSYKFVVADKASIHGFTLEKVKGGKFEKALSPVPFTGTKSVIVKLTAGKWKFYCPPHESSMFGFFTVK